ncbi:glucan 1,4-alpha-glucosidase [Brevundimonas goettingensis]|uniref:Glucan 1,4-alpha-glucosidase n=2 Tax=Brevundimonas goettingensis TaxID=2774190 RepID=A0A975GX07_9CAUL|nr:glucan 1,4-alpha-glucosidase [Brevundimonas goettingensis]QTC93206.1 glucan 1,4-alpha-glucosidase [Brevundimonas goettingensis]
MPLIQKLAASVGVAALLATGACASMPAAAVEASPAAPAVVSEPVAPGAPGAATTWSSAAKTGVGASYEAYVDGQYKDGGPTGAVSRVWFSIADGVLTETMYGLIHEAQIKSLRFALASDAGLSLEGTDTTERTEYLDVDAQGRPLSPAYRVVTTDKAGKYEIEKRIFTDPDRNALVLRVTIKATGAAVTPYAILEPHMANTGGGDFASADANGLYAHEGDVHLALRPSAPFETASAGFLGSSDGLTDLKANGRLTHAWASTGDTAGAVVLTGALPTIPAGQSLTRDFVIGFGASKAEAEAAADGGFSTGLDEVLARFNGTGDRLGWEDWIGSLTDLPRIAQQSTDGGKLAYASALMLKVQEDRTHAGALIASLSNPWGDTVDATNSSTGYKAVWPRDFYQVAMALLALGDTQTPVAAFRYLPQVQVRADTPGNTGATGWFLQKTHVDGEVEWVGVQLDQTAMPIMLGWRLWKAGLVSDAELQTMYGRMIKPAADFLVTGGKIGILWNDRTVTPPFTQQERWEEQDGFSPSTTAAVIAGLTVAADIAKASNDTASAARYLAAADDYSKKADARMFTTNGAFGDGNYFLRLSKTESPNSHAPMGDNNGQPGQPQDHVVDGGFLELVRYGVRAANDPHILATLPEYDDQTRPDLTRVRYDFGPAGDATPGWRRYGVDGYGEDRTNGANYGIGGVMAPGQRGRVWPIFTGERGHYELARALQSGGAADLTAIRQTYVRGMERFANDGLLLSEQVWDGVGVKPEGYETGAGTDSATPLAWSHAEYIKLLRSLADKAVWDRYAPVADRYGK